MIQPQLSCSLNYSPFWKMRRRRRRDARQPMPGSVPVSGPGPVIFSRKPIYAAFTVEKKGLAEKGYRKFYRAQYCGIQIQMSLLFVKGKQRLVRNPTSFEASTKMFD